MRPPWYPQTTRTKRKHTGAGKPLKVWSILWSQKNPATFIVRPAVHPRRAVRRAVCPRMATISGTQATRASGHISMPGNASQ